MKKNNGICAELCRLRIFFLCTSTIISLAAFPQSSTSNDSLYTNFQTPPGTAKPRVWWHWMNGNITKEGITKDLELMKRVGIGGFQNFDASLFTPVVVPK
jgi:hypothetical protein